MDKQGNKPSKSLANGVTRRVALKKLGVGLAVVLLALSLLKGMARADGSSAGFLLVSSFANDSVLRYDATTGAFVDAIVPPQSGGLREPFGLVFGLDGNLYVGSGLEPDMGTGHKNVLRYDGRTGAFLGIFADQNLLGSVRAILFGPDGNLYVANGYGGDGTDSVMRFDGRTGAFLDNFVAPGSGGFRNPIGMVFGPNGKKDGKLDLYVGCAFSGNILRYDGATGAFKGVFVSSGSGGLGFPGGLAFGLDGNLYVASYNLSDFIFPPGSILRFQGPGSPHPGAFMDTFVASGVGGLSTPMGVLFGPGGDLYVANSVCFQKQNNGKFFLDALPGTSQVLRYDGKTGAFKGVFVTADSGGLEFPCLMTFTKTSPTTLNYQS